MHPLKRKNELLLARAEIEARLERTRKHFVKDAPVSADFHEQAVETGNDAVIQALEREGLHELRKIDAALYRLETGEYGTCTACGGPIAEERLAALPYTDVCIACAAAGSE